MLRLEPGAGGVKRNLPSLGTLADPNRHREPPDLKDHGREALLGKLRDMLTVRFTEEEIAALVERGQARCPCHLGIGQEAVAVGISDALRPEDRVFGAHRSHAHYLALGGDVYPLVAEALGRATGCSLGLGGSMHLYGADVGFYGSVPIVAATIPMAVGAALAAKKDGDGAIALSYFGDGASEEGAFHESLNLAALWELPIVFVCENNLFSSHLDISLRQPSDTIARFAEANGIPAEVVDGNDVVAVMETARSFVQRARRGQGPGFIEAVTYRWRGHVGPREDIDVGLRRKGADLAAWKKRDPVERLVAAMRGRGDLRRGEFVRLVEETRETVRSAVQRAERAPYPDPGTLLDHVYAGRGQA